MTCNWVHVPAPALLALQLSQIYLVNLSNFSLAYFICGINFTIFIILSKLPPVEQFEMRVLTNGSFYFSDIKKSHLKKYMCVMCRLKEYLIILSQNLILEKKYIVKDKVTVFPPYLCAILSHPLRGIHNKNCVWKLLYCFDNLGPTNK